MDNLYEVNGRMWMFITPKNNLTKAIGRIVKKTNPTNPTDILSDFEMDKNFYSFRKSLYYNKTLKIEYSSDYEINKQKFIKNLLKRMNIKYVPGVSFYWYKK